MNYEMDFFLISFSMEFRDKLSGWYNESFCLRLTRGQMENDIDFYTYNFKELFKGLFGNLKEDYYYYLSLKTLTSKLRIK
jgi:hypothetical protein